MERKPGHVWTPLRVFCKYFHEQFKFWPGDIFQVHWFILKDTKMSLELRNSEFPSGNVFCRTPTELKHSESWSRPTNPKLAIEDGSTECKQYFWFFFSLFLCLFFKSWIKRCVFLCRSLIRFCPWKYYAVFLVLPEWLYLAKNPNKSCFS